MKAKEITIKYTTGKEETIEPKTTGFVIVNGGIMPIDDWTMDDAFMSAAGLLLTTMKACVDDFGSFTPLFDKMNEVMFDIKRQLSSAAWTKEYGENFQKNFLLEEIMEDAKLKPEHRKYKELYDKMDEFAKKALARFDKEEDKLVN